MPFILIFSNKESSVFLTFSVLFADFIVCVCPLSPLHTPSLHTSSHNSLVGLNDIFGGGKKSYEKIIQRDDYLDAYGDHDMIHF